MTLLFDRKVEIHVFADGQKTTITGLDMSFDVMATSDSSPNFAKFEIWNLSETSRNLFSKSTQGVEIYAGYGDDIGLIFRGAWDPETSTIQHVQKKADWVSMFECGDGEKEFNNSFFDKSYPAGTQITKILSDVAASFGLPTENDFYFIPTLGSGATFSGKAKDVLDSLAEEYELQWAIQMGVLEITDFAAPPKKDTTAVVLTPDTGMVGYPVLTDDGVEIPVMMLPNLSPNRLVKIDPATLQTSLGKEETKKKDKAKPPTPNADGLYIIDQLNTKGDNMGGEFNRYIITKNFNAKK